MKSKVYNRCIYNAPKLMMAKHSVVCHGVDTVHLPIFETQFSFLINLPALIIINHGMALMLTSVKVDQVFCPNVKIFIKSVSNSDWPRAHLSLNQQSISIAIKPLTLIRVTRAFASQKGGDGEKVVYDPAFLQICFMIVGNLT